MVSFLGGKKSILDRFDNQNITFNFLTKVGYVKIGYYEIIQVIN